MNRKHWLILLAALLFLAALAAIFLLPRLSPSPPPLVTLSPTPLVPTAPPTTAWRDLPTVTPPPPGMPTLPPEAQAMRAAPTATPSPIPPTPTPTPTPPPTSTPVPATGHDDVEMVEVPAGEFIMGVSEDTALDSYRRWYAEHSTGMIPCPEYSDQTPQLTVYLNTFSIDQLEVTNARYRRCVEAGFCMPHNYAPIEGYTSNPAYDHYPALVPWTDALAYCQWVGKRLPAEAEWEKAARGDDGRPYPWGQERQPDWANLDDKPMPVGSHPHDLSLYGALDMGGNALEWTLDLFQPYPGNPRWDRDSSGHVARGGFRGRVHPTTFRRLRHGLIGFRCVQGPEPPALAEAVVEISAYPTPAPTPQIDLSEMVYVPAGEFIMGNDDVGDDPVRQDEQPAHVVYLDGFYIDRYSVTAAELAPFLNAVGGHKWRCGSDCIYTQAGPEEKPVGLEIKIVDGHYVPGEGYEDMPVTIATWEGARDYCEWVGKRLLTEAEWEKAARGTDGRLYPWGNEWDPALPASGSRSIGDDAAPVGTHPGDVSPYGIYDMLGNVPEWVADWYDPEYYRRSPYTNPQGPDDGAAHVVRGHFGPIAKLGVTDRRSTRGITGFRCVYTP